VFLAIKHEFADFAELAFDDGIVFARDHFAREHSAGSELSRPGIELHADVRRKHWPKNGNVAIVIDAQEDEEQRFGFSRDGGQAARSNSAAKQKCCSADESFSHGNR